MSTQIVNKLSDQELLAKRKKTKKIAVINAALIGVFVGVALFSFMKKGFNFFTFFPLFFILLLAKNGNEYWQVEREVKNRKLK